jgi:hypothetical protein
MYGNTAFQGFVWVWESGLLGELGWRLLALLAREIALIAIDKAVKASIVRGG